MCLGGAGGANRTHPFHRNCFQVPEDGELLQDGTVRINVWASPRSLSTALMYSFAQVRCANQARVVGVVDWGVAVGRLWLVLLRWFPLLTASLSSNHWHTHHWHTHHRLRRSPDGIREPPKSKRECRTRR